MIRIVSYATRELFQHLLHLCTNIQVIKYFQGQNHGSNDLPPPDISCSGDSAVHWLSIEFARAFFVRCFVAFSKSSKLDLVCGYSIHSIVDQGLHDASGFP